MIRPSTMMRAFFAAVGIYLVIVGVECLVLDSAVFVAGVMDEPVNNSSAGMFSSPSPSTGSRIFKPSEWFPWSLIACGSIVLLYSVSLRNQSQSAG
jgi:hypothetical protein